MIENLSETGVTILLTTHHLEEAERLCSRIGIIKDGQIKAEGGLEELRRIIPAAQLAILETEYHDAHSGKVASFGWTYRHYGGRLTLWLPERFTLKGIVDKFDDMPLTSVSLKEVGLEHIYLEVTGH